MLAIHRAPYVPHPPPEIQPDGGRVAVAVGAATREAMAPKTNVRHSSLAHHRTLEGALENSPSEPRAFFKEHYRAY